MSAGSRVAKFAAIIVAVATASAITFAIIDAVQTHQAASRRTATKADLKRISLSFRDLLRGTSNTLAVVEDSRTDIQWLEPKDLLPGEFFHSFYHGKPWTKGGGRTVVAAASEDIDVTRNQLWAATFQIAWDELKQVVGGSVEFDRKISTLDHLNAASFDKGSVSPEARLIALTGIRPEDNAAILADLKQKFPDVEAPLHPADPLGRPGIRIYALIRKQMPFESLFDRFQSPLLFSTWTWHSSISDCALMKPGPTSSARRNSA